MALRKTIRRGAARDGSPVLDFERLTVEPFMVRDVPFSTPEASARSVAEMILAGHGTVPILDARRRLVGVVSEYDLLLSLEQGCRWCDLTAADLMSPNPYAIRPQTDIGTLVHVMVTSNLIRVPVVGAGNVLLGVIGRADLLRAYLAYDAERLTSL